jgi:hypothetical protein
MTLKKVASSILFVIMILSLNNGLSQTIPATLKSALLKEKKVEDISFLSNGYPFLGIPEENKETNNLQIVKHKGGLIVAVEGTNRIYQVDSMGGYKRLDKTSFSGYNFGASIFDYKDTLYSVGGYGFWQTNGSVRYFNENTGEWDILRNIQDVSFANGLNGISYFDSRHGKLYLIYTVSNPEYKKITNPDSKLYFQCFDFNKKDWLEAPLEINPNLAKEIREIGQIHKTSNGILCSIMKFEKPALLDFEKNMAYEVDDKFMTEIVQIENANKSGIRYISEGYLNIYNFSNDSFAHINTNIKKITSSGIPIFIEVEKSIVKKYSKYLYLFTSLILNVLLIIAVIYLSIQIQSKKEIAFNFENTTSAGTSNEFKKAIDFVNNLTVIEKELLETIVKNNLENKTTTVNQINKVLGTEKKSFKIQNNIRGEILTLINNKFIAFSLINDNLIERQRSEFDKRHMEYFINEKYIGKFPLKIFSA